MIKQVLTVALAAVLFTSCQQNSAQQKETADATLNASSQAQKDIAASPDAAIITFANVSHDFGKVKQGEKVQYDFKFKNTGKTPLIISNATATCGCTVPEVPKDPIMPGAEGSIRVIFDTTGKIGINDKVVTVTSNANSGTDEVHLIGEVVR